MKKIIFSIVTLCCAVGFVQAQEPECPDAATATSTISFRRNTPSILPGAFSVSSTKQVNFTKGNLQYNAAYNSWRFAENQYIFIGDAAGNNVATEARATQDAWIDIFGWGTSGYDNTAVDPTAEHYQPWSYVQASVGDANNTYHYGPSLTVMPAGTSWSGSLLNYDWGVYNFKAGVEAGCRTMTQAEWAYLLTTRCGNTGLTLCGHGNLFGANGLFLLPDGWSWDAPAVAAAVTAASFEWVPSATAKLFTNNVIADNEKGRALWHALEDAGVVFLPATGYRYLGEFRNVNARGAYASSTVANKDVMYCMVFYSGGLNVDVSGTAQRSTELAVRLVKDVAP